MLFIPSPWGSMAGDADGEGVAEGALLGRRPGVDARRSWEWELVWGAGEGERERERAELGSRDILMLDEMVMLVVGKDKDKGVLSVDRVYGRVGKV